MANPTNLSAVTAKVVSAGGLNEIMQESEKAALIADAVVAHDVNATFSDTEVEAALDALGGKINAIIDALIEVGVMKSS